MRLVKNIFIISVSFSILIALLMWMQGLFNADRVAPELLEEASEDLPHVQTVRTQYRILDQTADAVGSIQSRSTATVASKILANILTVNFRPGDSVKKGDLLITLATFAVIVSFLPMFFITGMMGPYMAPMALNVPWFKSPNWANL